MGVTGGFRVHLQKNRMDFFWHSLFFVYPVQRGTPCEKKFLQTGTACLPHTARYARQFARVKGVAGRNYGQIGLLEISIHACLGLSGFGQTFYKI